MKKLLKALCILVIIFSHAQVNRFFYEYKYINDINNKEDVKRELMILDIDAKGSSYYSHKSFIADSTTRADLEKQMKANNGNFSIKNPNRPGEVQYRVTKSYPDFKTYLYQKISTDLYKILEDSKPEWKISSEKQKIGEYNTQKATTSFGGRDWTAWFTQEIPFQDGPYKFYGLPGLIVKLEDSTGTHVMTLSGNKKIIPVAGNEDLNIPQEIKLIGFGGKEIEATENQYRKLWKAYTNDPTKNMREMMSRNTDTNKVIFKTQSSSGQEISDPNQVFREMEKRVKEDLKKNNNPIEPDLQK